MSALTLSTDIARWKDVKNTNELSKKMARFETVASQVLLRQGRRALCVFGGSGFGKSFIINRLIANEQENMRCLLC